MAEETRYPDARNAQELKDWLRVALDAWYGTGHARRALRPFGRFVGRHADLAADLHAAYRSRPAAERGRWRTAVRDLLAEHAADVVRNADAAETLIDLATRMPAPGVLEVLPGLVRGLEGRSVRRLANRVVSAATALAPRTADAVACLESIRTAPWFATHHGGLVLTALCRADPDGWPGHVVDLEPAMQRLADVAGGEALRRYAERILASISLSRVSAAAVDELNRQLLERRGNWTNWLYEAWFVGRGSILVQDRDELRMREKPEICARFDDRPLGGDYVGDEQRDALRALLAAFRAGGDASPATVVVAERIETSWCMEEAA